MLFVGLLEIAPCSQAGNLTLWRGGFGGGPGVTESGSPTSPCSNPRNAGHAKRIFLECFIGLLPTLRRLSVR